MENEEGRTAGTEQNSDTKQNPTEYQAPKDILDAEKALHKTGSLSREEKQLLEDILAQSKKQTGFERISAIANCVLAGIFAVALLVLVPIAVVTMNDASKTMSEANDALKTVEDSASQIDVLVNSAQTSLSNINMVVTNVNQVVDDNAKNVTESVQKINDIDFDSLNSSIQRLNDSLEPFANTVNFINGMTGGSSK
jgi:uncharacterized protein YoxC